MMMLEETQGIGACIKVIGVGGGGGNAINTMVDAGIDKVEFIAANTDVQALANNRAVTRIQIGEQRTHGLGAGAKPNVGLEAAQESATMIQDALKGADMVFVTAGMGGGTGTGAAPFIAGLAKQLGALTVGIVTKPFKFEGRQRRRQADEGIENLRQNVDTLITIPNERLLSTSGEQMTLVDAFRRADSVLLDAVRAISELITKTGFVNTDFADVSTVMTNKGMALMGTGIGEGPNRATDAAVAAISSPLLDDISLEGATSILFNITAPRDASIVEISAAATLIQDAAAEDANIIWGHVFPEDESNEEFKITIIATGFQSADSMADTPSSTDVFRSSFLNNSVQSPRSYSAPMSQVMSPAVSAPSKMVAETPRADSMEIAQRFQEYDAQSDLMYANSPRQSSSYAPSPKPSYAPSGKSQAPTSESYAAPDIYASVQKPASSVKSSAVNKNAAKDAIDSDILDDAMAIANDDYSTPAFMRNSGKKKNFLDNL